MRERSCASSLGRVAPTTAPTLESPQRPTSGLLAPYGRRHPVSRPRTAVNLFVDSAGCTHRREFERPVVAELATH
jgi:hypothetical protein